jgi:adenylate cyclase
MAEERAQRRLAAILAADVVGYSRLMEENEADTYKRLRAHRKDLFEPQIESHHGRIFKLMGDGLLAEFVSVVDAVECAVTLQRGMAERNAGLADARRIDMRIGINLGDVIVEDDDVHGDGVNIAARLQGLAHGGGIVVSGTAYDHLQGKLSLPLDFAGEQQVKNLARPVRIYRVRLDGIEAKTAPPLPDKPSIAVLPFQNLSGDPEQEYFADGMVEEIITALSRMRWLFVIARNSSFTYKGRAVDVKQVGRELGVRYVLEGSIRKAGNRVRITGQLIDTSRGTHIWADRFDGGIEDVFDLQDQVAASVVGAIAPKLEQAEIERAKRKATESLDAYDYYLRGLAAVRQDTQETVSKALELFFRAIELDGDFASAYGMAAWCYVRRKTNGWTTDPEKEKADTARIARRAVELGKDDAVALTFGGFSLAYVVGDLDDGAAMIDRALALNPNLAAAWSYSGWIRTYRGEMEPAIEHQVRAMRLSPLDALMYNMQGGAALAHFLAGRYDQASSLAEEALRNKPDYTSALRILAASRALTDRQEDAQKAVMQLCRVDPASRVSNLRDRVPLRRREDLAKLEDGLRKAGLPE